MAYNERFYLNKIFDTVVVSFTGLFLSCMALLAHEEFGTVHVVRPWNRQDRRHERDKLLAEEKPPHLSQKQTNIIKNSELLQCFFIRC